MFDGGMGTMLQKSGLPVGEMPETLNIVNPDFISSVHRAYIDAGSDIVYTNTFGANKYKAVNTGYSVDELIKAGIKNAKKAIETMGFEVSFIDEEALFNGDKRIISYFRKVKTTPLKYPRKYNIIKKSPL